MKNNNAAVYVLEKSRKMYSDKLSWYHEQGPKLSEKLKYMIWRETHCGLEDEDRLRSEGLLRLIKLRSKKQTTPSILTFLIADNTHYKGGRFTPESNVVALTKKTGLTREEVSPSYYLDYLQENIDSLEDKTFKPLRQEKYVPNAFRILEQEKISKTTLIYIMSELENKHNLIITVPEGKLNVCRSLVSLAFTLLPSAHKYREYRETFGREKNTYEVLINYDKQPNNLMRRTHSLNLYCNYEYNKNDITFFQILIEQAHKPHFPYIILKTYRLYDVLEKQDLEHLMKHGISIDGLGKQTELWPPPIEVYPYKEEDKDKKIAELNKICRANTTQFARYRREIKRLQSVYLEEKRRRKELEKRTTETTEVTRFADDIPALDVSENEERKD